MHINYQAALALVQPSAKREGFATIPDVTWDDVGALKDVRGELTMAILVSSVSSISTSKESSSLFLYVVLSETCVKLLRIVKKTFCQQKEQ